MARAVEANPAAVAARTARAIDVGRPRRRRAAAQPRSRVRVRRGNAALGVHRDAAARALRQAAAPHRRGQRDARGHRRGDGAHHRGRARRRAARLLRGGRAPTRRVTIAQELEQLATRARDAAQERFQTGAAPRLEALQASLALAQAQNEVGAARGDAQRGARRAERAARLSARRRARAGRSARGGAAADARRRRRSRRSAGNAELQVLQKRIDEARARVDARPGDAPSGSVGHGEPDLRRARRVHLRAGAPAPASRCRSSRPASPTSPSPTRRSPRRSGPRRARRADHRRGRRRRSRARPPRGRPSIATRTRSCRPRCRWNRWPTSRTAPARPACRPTSRPLQAARDVRQRALQAGLDYQLALADLERAMGTPLK